VSAAEKAWVRCTLSAFVVLVSVAFTPLMLLLKLTEGVCLATKITRDCLAQIWGTSEPR